MKIRLISPHRDKKLWCSESERCGSQRGAAERFSVNIILLQWPKVTVWAFLKRERRFFFSGAGAKCRLSCVRKTEEWNKKAFMMLCCLWLKELLYIKSKLCTGLLFRIIRIAIKVDVHVKLMQIVCSSSCFNTEAWKDFSPETFLKSPLKVSVRSERKNDRAHIFMSCLQSAPPKDKTWLLFPFCIMEKDWRRKRAIFHFHQTKPCWKHRGGRNWFPVKKIFHFQTTGWRPRVLEAHEELLGTSLDQVTWRDQLSLFFCSFL